MRKSVCRQRIKNKFRRRKNKSKKNERKLKGGRIVLSSHSHSHCSNAHHLWILIGIEWFFPSLHYAEGRTHLTVWPIISYASTLSTSYWLFCGRMRFKADAVCTLHPLITKIQLLAQVNPKRLVLATFSWLPRWKIAKIYSSLSKLCLHRCEVLLLLPLASEPVNTEHAIYHAIVLFMYSMNKPTKSHKWIMH